MAETGPATLPWRQSLPHIISSTQQEDYEECSRLCLAFLGAADSSTDGGADDDPPPGDVLATVRTTYARSLLHLEDYATLVDYCKSFRQASSGGGGASLEEDPFHLRQEEAYAQYRLKNYAKARDLCRSALTTAGFDPNDLTQPVEGDDLLPLGLVHIYGQSLYRLHETEVAAKVYEYLQAVSTSAGGGGGTRQEEEVGEVMTNALANTVANATYSGSKYNVVDEESTIQEQITSGEDYNYDLARNLALIILIGATSASDLRRAIKLLHQAEDGARTALEEDGATDQEIATELAPILADMATANQMLGDRQSASRSYFDLMRSDDAAVKFVAGHNLAVLSSATNPAGAAKQMPAVDDSVKLTAAQARTVLFSRALLALANKRHDESRQALAALKSAISASAGGRKHKKKGKDGAGSALLQLSAPSANAADEAIWSSRIVLVESELLRAERKTDEAAAALRSAIDALTSVETDVENDCNSDDANSKREAVQFGLAALSLHKLEVDRAALPAPRSEDDEDGVEEKEEEATAASDPIEILSNLPASVKTRPAVLGALSALHSQAGREDKIAEIVDLLSSSSTGEVGAGNVESAKIKSAQFVKSGRYEDAITVLRSALCADGMSEETYAELTARLIQALSYVDPAEAEVLVSSLLDSDEASVLPDGEELEGRETPRLGKGSGAIGRRVGGAASEDRSVSQEKKAKREAALRRRAKKREAYLEKLESEGRYNPDRPSKPDPERWIPKAQRSYSRRGRRGRQRFVGAQGGGTGAGADRDAARLDAAARAAAKRDGTATSSSKPSTAHMEVSGGGHGRRKGGRR